MAKIPENTDELTDFILADVLYGVELDPVSLVRIRRISCWEATSLRSNTGSMTRLTY